MQGSKTPLIVLAAAAVVVISLSGCTVHNYPAAPAAQNQQQQPQAQAVQNAKAAPAPAPAPAPATRSAAAPAPQRKPAPAPEPAAGRAYTFKPGDNLWNISKEVYGDGTKYQRILDANPGLNPDNMKPGTKIVIP